MEPRETDTIVAVATPPGEGGLGVVRLSGPRALEVADAMFRAAAPLVDVPSHTLHHGVVRDADETLDDAVAAVFRAPRSYTGEDVVELSCHGGSLLMTRVLELCLRRGARLAGPGEFTRRAYENGKMDLTQAEAVADLIAARSDALRRAGLAQLRGGCPVGWRRSGNAWWTCWPNWKPVWISWTTKFRLFRRINFKNT